MKSMQLLLLMCIYLGERFPRTLDTDDIISNLEALKSKELIVDDSSDMVTGYKETDKAVKMIMDFYSHDSLSN